MYDWQSTEVVDWLTTQLFTDIYEWRADRGRHARADQDHADLRRAIAFAGEKLDGFQMARFLEDSRLWPADQQLVLRLQYAAKERDMIVAKLNRPPAPPRIDGASEVAIGAVFKENGEEYTVTGGPDVRGDWEVTQTSTTRVFRNISRDTIQRYLDLALQNQPNVQAPVQVAIFTGLRFKDYVGRRWIVQGAAGTPGEYYVRDLDRGTTESWPAASIQERYRDNGPC